MGIGQGYLHAQVIYSTFFRQFHNHNKKCVTQGRIDVGRKKWPVAWYSSQRKQHLGGKTETREVPSSC